MLTRIVALALLAAPISASLPDLGYPGWKCDDSVYKKSKNVPTSAHSVRFSDIKVIGALGDSLTAANGAGAAKGDPLAVILQYRGLAFQCGGDSTLDEHVTVANVLKKFNPNIIGYSTGIGSANVWEVAKLNQAIPGAEAIDIITQARSLVHIIQAHKEIDVKNDWKLINIFIGANDMCAYCEQEENGPHSKELWKKNVITAVQILKDNLPRYRV
uniref:SGNH hydrolase-type esterase domain-containing protein n=1 Tax=Caenorhabditis japonica TaxID=281687 RepID=A0A8R1HX78_CAEJA